MVQAVESRCTSLSNTCRIGAGGQGRRDADDPRSSTAAARGTFGVRLGGALALLKEGDAYTVARSSR